jgi:lipoprotein-anchoring transpeptidase ErfK/SrfK
MAAKMNRREFLKLSGFGIGALFLPPLNLWKYQAPEFPQAEKLGRVCTGTIKVRAHPSAESASVGTLYPDGVVVWQREVIGEAPLGWVSRRWVETPNGYIYAPDLQPVKNIENTPIAQLPDSLGGPGFWAEVSVPYVDVTLANPPARSPWLKAATMPRLYFSQIMWIDGIKQTDSGATLYRVNERYGTLGDIFWARAEAFRPLTAEEIAPIHPEVTEKRVEVNLAYQTLSAFEGSNEVYFCRISSGGKWDSQGNVVDKWSTPVGPHPIWRKLISIHMIGGTTGAGYDLPGIGWTTLFSGEGVAIHSTFWHNDYGVPRSHGCVNAAPDDAKWIFRWTTPIISLDPGDMTVQMPGGTTIKVNDA